MSAVTDAPVRRLAGRVRDGALRRWPRGRVVTAVALTLITAHLLFRGWMTAGSWFMWDDYIFIGQVTLGMDDFGWLFHSHFSLFMPVSFLLVKSVAWAGLDWPVVATQMIVLQALAALACWWMLRVVFGNRARILVPLAFYLVTPMTVASSVWWSVAINQLPHHVALFGAIAAHVTYARTGRVRWAIVATLFVVLGVGSYLKAALIVPVLLGISVVWFTRGPWRTRLRTLAASWPAWLMYAAVTIGYAVAWWSVQTGAAPRQRCELPSAMSTSVLDTVVTGVLGGPWSWRLWTGGIDPFVAASDCVPQVYRGSPDLVVGGAPQSLTDAPLLLVLVATLVLAAMVFYVWGRRHDALRAAWILVPYVLVSALLVYAGRAGTFGSQVSAREVRYFSDVAALLAFGLGTVIMPIRGALHRPGPRADPYLRLRLPRPVLVGLAGAVVVGSVGSSVAYTLPWHDRWDSTAFPERTFVNDLLDDLDRRDERSTSVVDVPLPPVIGNPVIAPFNRPSHKLASLAPRLKAVSAGTDLGIIDDDGRIQLARVTGGSRAEPGPVEGCGYLVNPEETIDVSPVLDLPFWMQVDYLSSMDGTVVVTAGDTSVRVPVEEGLHSMFLATEGTFSEVTIRSETGAAVCVDTIRVGDVEPVEDAR